MIQRLPGSVPGRSRAVIHDGRVFTVTERANGSKGCGGVMRAAPAGLTGLHDPFGLGADAAAVTHGHPSGYFTAGFLARLGGPDAPPRLPRRTVALLRTDARERSRPGGAAALTAYLRFDSDFRKRHSRLSVAPSLPLIGRP